MNVTDLLVSPRHNYDDRLMKNRRTNSSQLQILATAHHSGRLTDVSSTSRAAAGSSTSASTTGLIGTD